MSNITQLPDEYLYVLMNQYGLTLGIDPAIQEKYSNMDQQKLNQISADMQDPQFWAKYDMQATGDYIMNQSAVDTQHISSDKLNSLYGQYQGQGGTGSMWDKSSYDVNGNFVGKNADYNIQANKLGSTYGYTSNTSLTSANPYEREMAGYNKSIMDYQAALDRHEQALKDPSLSGYKLNNPDGTKSFMQELMQRQKDLQVKADEWNATATDEMKNAPVADSFGIIHGQKPTHGYDPNTVALSWGIDPSRITMEMSNYFNATGDDPRNAPGANPVVGQSFETWLNSDAGKAAGYTGGYVADNYLWQQQNPKDQAVVTNQANIVNQGLNKNPDGSYMYRQGNTFGSGSGAGWATNGTNNVFYGIGKPMPDQNYFSSLFNNTNGNKIV